jgi:hypothetical protein
VNVETKEQAVKAVAAHTFTKKKRRKILNKRFLPAINPMTAVLWDRTGGLKVDFMQQGNIIML